jgi:hypothetical protein
MRKEREETMKMRLSNKKDVRKRVNTDKQREQQRKRMIECRENRKRKRKKNGMRKEENIEKDKE